MNRARILSFAILLAVLCAPVVLAADPPANNMDILREKLRADKKLLVAANMQLTESEAKAFWPVYDSYQAELATVAERLKKTVNMYADAWNARNITDEMAKKLVADMMAIDETMVQQRKELLPKLHAVLPPVKVMRYLQIENKIMALIRYDLSQGVPLAP